jgi:hypothetical protein
MVYMRFFAQNNLLNMLVKFVRFTAEHHLCSSLSNILAYVGVTVGFDGRGARAV